MPWPPYLPRWELDFNAIHELLINLFQGGGVYSYSGSAAFNNWVADVTGVNLGDGLTGRHFTTFVQVTDPITGIGKDDFYDNDFAGFFEDTWKAKPNLTFNLGVRYDLSQHIPAPPKPQHEHAADDALHLHHQHRQEQLCAAPGHGVVGR